MDCIVEISAIRLDKIPQDLKSPGSRAEVLKTLQVTTVYLQSFCLSVCLSIKALTASCLKLLASSYIMLSSTKFLP